jgi:hypothetical protein
MQLSDEDLLKALCAAHDLTFEYSDDIRSFRAGNEQLKAIEIVAARLPREVAVRIWNDAVDAKVLAPHNKQYHWEI